MTGDCGMLNIETPLILVDYGFFVVFLATFFGLFSIVMFVMGFGGLNLRFD